MKKICNLYNIPSHYRERIYKKMDEEFDCTFVFGDENLKIKKMDLTELKKAKETHVGFIKSAAFQWGIIPFAFKNFDAYILTGSTNNITHWIFLALLKLMPRKKTLIWTHGLYGYESKRQLLVRRLFYSLVDEFLIYGEYARDNMIKAGISSPEKLHVIHNSLNYDEQMEIRKSIVPSTIYKEHFGNDNPTIIFIGRLTTVKKLDMVLDALSILRDKGHSYNMVFVGDGTEKDNLGGKCRSLHLDNQVWFYGSCYDEVENANLIYNADVCVSPGNVGLTALHAMMFGTPIITHNNYPWQMPEFQTIIEGKTGSFFEENNIDSLSETIHRWLDKHTKERDVIRRNCFEVIDIGWNPYYQIELLKRVL